MLQQESRFKMIPDESLRQMLIQMTQAQPSKIGTPEYILAAGEIQSRKDARQKTAGQQAQQPPVLAELLAGAPMTPPMAPPMMAPDAMESGVANLPAPNMDGFADGGIVAFAAGDAVVPTMLPPGMQRQEDPKTLRAYYLSRGLPVPAELLTNEEKAAAARAPYPAGVFPKIGRAASDVGGAISGFIAPQGFGYYQDAQQAAVPSSPVPTGQVNLGDNPEEMRRRALAPTANVAPPPAPPRAPAQGGGIGSLFGQTEEFMSRFGGPKPEPTPTGQQAVDERMNLYKGMGVDFAVNDELRNKILEGAKDRDKEKTDAGLMALAQFGFTLASTPGSLLNAVGQAATPALKQYGAEIKDLKKAAREDDKLLAQLKQNDNAMRMGVTDKGMEDRQKIVDRMETNRLNSIRTAGTVYGGLLSLQGTRESTAASTAAAKETRELNELGRKKDTALRETNDALLKEMTTNPLLAQDPVAYNRRKNALYAENLALLQSKESTGPATPMGKVVNGVYVLNPPAGK
jgi:hypothetical protein